MSESMQKKKERVRPPRVQIGYDVEIGDAILNKELPFVMGAMADLSGKPAEPLEKLRDRKFVTVERDNFDEVLAASKPRLAYRVDNRITEDGNALSVELNFKSMEDFEPHRVAQQIAPLQKLLEAREKLTQLMAALDGNDRGMEVLDSIIRDSEQLKAILGEDRERSGE